MDESLETLFLPLESGDVVFAQPALFMGAAQHGYLYGHDMDLWQVFKPLAESCGASSELPDRKYSLILVNVPKQVDEARYWLALALERLEVGGTLLACAANDANGARLEGWFKEAGLAPHSQSKNKCRAVWAVRPDDVSMAVNNWREEGAAFIATLDGGDYHTQAGLFSYDHIDPASEFLMQHLPPALSGSVADFGAGWGYLSRAILETYPKVQSITLVEADARALKAAETNLEKFDLPKEFLWHDATKSLGDAKFDYIIMNPPFHKGKKTDVSLGQKFITNAAAHLKKGGSLTLVANTQLPYESVLDAHLKNTKHIAQGGGFKILRAVK